MKLLFDQNLSRNLVAALSAVYPDSSHVALCGLETADDRAVWDYAKEHGLWIRLGNCTTGHVEALLRVRAANVREFVEDEDAALLVLP